MPAYPQPAGQPEPDTMDHIRQGIERVTEHFGVADFDSVNAVVTIKRVSADLENFASGYCKQYDLSTGRLNVLMTLYASNDKAMALSEIGEYLVVTRPNVTGLIDGLAEDGLVKRTSHPDDRRMVLAQLTPAGRDFVRKFVPFHHRVLNDVMAGITKQEKRQLVALLDKLRLRLRSMQVPQMEEV